MDISSKIFKRKSKTDHRKGKYVLRITYVDAKSTTRYRERQFSRRSEAVDARPGLEAELRITNGQIRVGERMTFHDLVKIALRDLYKPAVVVQGRKQSGVRSVVSARSFISTLDQFFGTKRIGDITDEDLTAYKVWRFGIGSRLKKTDEFVPISIATVNRELATMCRIMKYAYKKGWIARDVFAGAQVIDIGAEIARDRLLTSAEEERLLSCSVGPREITYKTVRGGVERTVSATVTVYNSYLKSIILLALDSALRRGEILKLRWQDLDFDNGTIRIIGTHTKTERERLVPLTERTKAELRLLPTFGPEGQVFPLREFKRSWKTAVGLAEIENLHFHDLRRTAVTGFIRKGIDIGTAGKIAGHAWLQTTMKHYVATDAEIIREVTDKLNASQAK